MIVREIEGIGDGEQVWRTSDVPPLLMPFALVGEMILRALGQTTPSQTGAIAVGVVFAYLLWRWLR